LDCDSHSIVEVHGSSSAYGRKEFSTESKGNEKFMGILAVLLLIVGTIYFNRESIFSSKYATVYVKRGIVYGEKGNFGKAMDCFDRAIELNSRCVEAHFWSGLVYHGNGDFDDAIKSYSKAIKLNPNYAAAYWVRAEAYGKKGDYDAKRRDHNKAKDLDPGLAKRMDNEFRGLLLQQLENSKRSR